MRNIGPMNTFWKSPHPRGLHLHASAVHGDHCDTGEIMLVKCLSAYSITALHLVPDLSHFYVNLPQLCIRALICHSFNSGICHCFNSGICRSFISVLSSVCHSFEMRRVSFRAASARGAAANEPPASASASQAASCSARDVGRRQRAVGGASKRKTKYRPVAVPVWVIDVSSSVIALSVILFVSIYSIWHFTLDKIKTAGLKTSFTNVQCSVL